MDGEQTAVLSACPLPCGKPSCKWEALGKILGEADFPHNVTGLEISEAGRAGEVNGWRGRSAAWCVFSDGISQICYEFIVSLLSGLGLMWNFI